MQVKNITLEYSIKGCVSFELKKKNPTSIFKKQNVQSIHVFKRV